MLDSRELDNFLAWIGDKIEQGDTGYFTDEEAPSIGTLDYMFRQGWVDNAGAHIEHPHPDISFRGYYMTNRGSNVAVSRCRRGGNLALKRMGLT